MKPTPKYASRPPSDDPREIEAWALTEAARRIVDAGRDPSNTEGLQAALQLNQRLWTIFQAAISEDECQLPHDVRTNVAALSLMVDRETMARLVDLDATKLDLLVNINRNVAAGLSQKVEADVPLPMGQAAMGQTPMGQAPKAPSPMAQGIVPPVRPAAPETPPAPRAPLRISI